MVDSWLRGYMFRKRQDRWESFNFNVVRSYEVSRHQLINSSWSHQERGEEISLAAEIADVFFMAFKDTSTMASWGLIIGKSLSEGLEVTFKMSYALGYTVRLITIRHQQVLTKSGIISSDPATKAPEIRWVKVVEQALVGIPLWLLDLPSRLPKIPYFIFPGSVGDNKALNRWTIWNDESQRSWRRDPLFVQEHDLTPFSTCWTCLFVRVYIYSESKLKFADSGGSRGSSTSFETIFLCLKVALTKEDHQSVWWKWNRTCWRKWWRCPMANGYIIGGKHWRNSSLPHSWTFWSKEKMLYKLRSATGGSD